MKNKLLIRGALAALAISTLSGCAAVVLAGAGATALSANDRRTVGMQIDDNAIELKVASALAELDAVSEHANINVTAYNGTLLVTGQAPNEMLRDQAIKQINTVPNVVKLLDQVRITSVASWATASSDTWITSKVKTEFLTNDKLEGLQIKVKTENSEVFLMGLLKPEEADLAVELARNVSGVERVIKIFEYI